MTTPEWLLRHLVATGLITEDGVSRKARLRSCRRCGGPVIVGLDHQPCGRAVAADPVDLDPVAELVALAAGRSTYSLTRTPSLEHRGRYAIGGKRRYPVLPQHRCRDGVPLRIDDAVLRVLAPAALASNLTDIPPY